MDNNCYRLGLDVGSTTAKIVILDPRGEVAFCDYRPTSTESSPACCTMPPPVWATRRWR